MREARIGGLVSFTLSMVVACAPSMPESSAAPDSGAAELDAASHIDAESVGDEGPWRSCDPAGDSSECPVGWRCENRNLVRGVSYARCTRDCVEGEAEPCAEGGVCGRWFPDSSMPLECLRRAAYYERCDTFTACPESSVCAGLYAFADGTLASFCLPFCGESGVYGVPVVDVCPPIPRELQSFRGELRADIPTACHRMPFSGAWADVCVAIAEVGGHCDESSVQCTGLLDVERPDTAPEREEPGPNGIPDVGDLFCGFRTIAGGDNPYHRSGICTRRCDAPSDCICPESDPACRDPSTFSPGWVWGCVGTPDARFPDIRICMPFEPCEPGSEVCDDNTLHTECGAPDRFDLDGDGATEVLPGYPPYICRGPR